VPELIDEVTQRLQTLSQSLVRRLEAEDVSIREKLPFHVVQNREGLAWRLAELSQDALQAMQAGRLASASLLVRAAVETVAALWYLQKKVADAIQSHSTAELHATLHRLLLGSRTSELLPEAINVLTFVDAVEKDLEGFRHQFDQLCEYAHPNWAGTASLFSKTNLEERAVNFGRHPDGSEHVEILTAVNLSVALGLFEHAYNQLADMHADLVQLAEANLRAR
jgi:hypothetical protein